MIDIKDFLINILKERIDTDITLHTGRQDDKEEKSLFISNSSNQDKTELYNQTYFKQNISMVINWNDNYTETRKKCLEIYKSLKSINKFIIDDNTIIINCEMKDNFPNDYQSKTKIYKQKIDFTIRYMIFL